MRKWRWAATVVAAAGLLAPIGGATAKAAPAAPAPTRKATTQKATSQRASTRTATGATTVKLIARPEGRVLSVSCPTTTFCRAADISGWAETYQHGHWTRPGVIRIHGAALEGGGVTSLSCPTPSFCAAVANADAALVYRNGSWSETTLVPDPSVDNPLEAVSCSSATWCVAVDADSDAYTFGGSRWSRGTRIDSPHDGVANPTTVSCAPGTSDYCVAADDAGQVIVHSQGRWSRPKLVDPNPAQGNVWGAIQVSCSSPSLCAFVDGGGWATTETDGRWGAPVRLIRNRDPDGAVFNAVACGRSACILDNGHQTFIGAGTHWTRSRATGLLNGVGCGPTAAPLACAGVADTQGERYTGHRWQAATTIEPTVAALKSVSCPTTTFCAAAGAPGLALVEKNGAWSAPEQLAYLGLPQVSCASADFCALVGLSGQVWTYDGTSWTRAAGIPDAGTGVPQLSCPEVDYCVASAAAGASIYHDGTWTEPDASVSSGPLSCAPGTTFCMVLQSATQVAVLDGGTWSTQTTSLDGMGAVTCATPTFCAVAGAYFVAYYDGSTWSTPEPVAPRGDVISDLSCPSSDFCAGVIDPNQLVTSQAWGTPVDAGNPGYLEQVSCPATGSCTAVDDEGYAVSTS